MDTFEATFDKVIYQKEDAGVLVGLYKGKDKCFIVTGTMLPTAKKTKYIFKGNWNKHPKYGMQFNASEGYDVVKPDGKDAILEYLSSGVIKGVGAKTAEKIVALFGEDTMNILDKDIDRLREVKGITENRFQKIKESYQASFEGREAILELTKRGISPKLASKAYQEFKDKTLNILKDRPYMLCVVPGITFPIADAFGSDDEAYEKSLERFLICANYVLFENEQNGLRNIIGNRPSGSTCMEINDFGRCMLSLLNKGTYKKEEILANTIALVKEDKLSYIKKDGKQYIYRSGIYRIEKRLAEDIERLATVETEKINIDEYINDYEGLNSILLNDDQKNAVRMAINSNFSLIIGSPGTGKTTIIKVIAYIYKKLNPKAEMTFLAMTGKAAYRITESTGFEARTVHSRLGLRAEIINDLSEEEEDKKIESGLVVVDELSMLDERTAYQLFSNISSECKVVLCGDDEQLPSVSAGAVLRDIIDSKTVPSVTLNQVYRQAKGSSIYENSFKIRNNDLNLILGEDFYILEEPDVSKIEDELIELYIKKISEYGIEEVMLLVPFKEHEGGVTPLNQKIQERLHPEHLQEKEFRLGMKRFRIGDRVMQLKNSDEQVNGECGTVIDIGKSDGEQTVTVKFDRSERTYTDDEADEITLAYACTIHKSQGSEGKCVIMFLHSMHSMLLKKNLVYTGISRSREECYILGEKSAVLKAIQTTDESRRLTGLSMFLKDESLWRVG